MTTHNSTITGHTKVLDTAEAFRRKTERALPISQLSDSQLDMHSKLLGMRYNLGGLMPASHCGLRLQLLPALASRITNDVVQHGWDDRPEIYHITIVHDVWNTTELWPRINLKSLQRKVRDELNGLDLNFVAFVEVTTYANMAKRGEKGRLVSPHVHILAWSSKDFRRTRVSKDLKAAFLAPIELAGNDKAPKSAKIVRVKHLDNLDYIIGYQAKLPARVKRVYRNGGEVKLLTVGDNNDRFIMFSRLAEILSQVELTSLVFAGGDGIAIRREAVAELRRWVKKQTKRRDREVSYLEVRQFWADVNRHRNRLDLRPVELVMP